MLLPPVLIILSVAITAGKGQFFYNYEERDDAALNPRPIVEEEGLNNPAPRAEVAENFRQSEATAGRSPRTEVTEEVRSPRRRQYRRLLREGTYVQPPTTPAPITYGPSVFENIQLGEAPNGVYIPEDSFLNVLRNPSRRREVSYSVQPYSSNFATPNHFQNNVREPTFYVSPGEQRRPESTILSVNEPNVQYASSPSVPANKDYSAVDDVLPAPRRVRPNRLPPRQKPAQTRSGEPVVDIDVLRTPLDIMIDMTPIPAQVIQRNQGRRASQNRRRQASRIQYDSDPIETPRVYAPSVFQNIGLGEAPSGVDIPSDSLLNVLRNPSSNSSPRRITGNSQVSVQPQNAPQPDNLQPEIMSTDYRRRSRQESRNSNAPRQTNYQFEDEMIPEPVQSVPASSQQQRRQRNRSNKAVQNQRYSSTPSESRSPRRQQQVHVESQQPRDTSTDQRQRKFKVAKLAIATLPEDRDDDGIPGEAGVDYPTFHTIPRTAFSCREQAHNGYYADLDTSCQVMHLCQDRGVQSSFLCPNGTIFSQEKFSCQWWYKVNCADSPKFYSINDNLYKIPEEKKTRS